MGDVDEIDRRLESVEELVDELYDQEEPATLWGRRVERRLEELEHGVDDVYGLVRDLRVDPGRQFLAGFSYVVGALAAYALAVLVSDYFEDLRG